MATGFVPSRDSIGVPGCQESAWEREMETALSQVKGTPAEPPVEWLRKRSVWLRGAPQEAPEPWLRPTLAPLLAARSFRWEE